MLQNRCKVSELQFICDLFNESNSIQCQKILFMQQISDSEQGEILIAGEITKPTATCVRGCGGDFTFPISIQWVKIIYIGRLKLKTLVLLFIPMSFLPIKVLLKNLSKFDRQYRNLYYAGNCKYQLRNFSFFKLELGKCSVEEMS